MKARKWLALLLSVLLVVGLLTACGDGGGSGKDKDKDSVNSSAKTAAVEGVKAQLGANGGRTLVDLTLDEYVEEMLESDYYDYDNESDIVKEYNDELVDRYDDMVDYYGEFKVKVEVREVTEWKNSRVKDYNKALENRDYDTRIEEGADVELKVTVDGKEDKKTIKTTVSVVKVDGKWFVVDADDHMF